MKSGSDIPGKVLKAGRKTYDVVLADQTIVPCTMRGKLAVGDDDYDAVRVGDNVTITYVSEQEGGTIDSILPRTSKLSRTIESRAYQEHIIAVNITQLLILLSTKNPTFKSGLLDRYLVIAEKNQIRPLICINKIDLVGAEHFQIYKDYYEKLDYPVIFTSAKTGEGVDALAALFNNATTALVGYSGVGKSSLIKAIRPGLDIKIGDISEHTQRGRHTTTAAQLFPLDKDSFVIDTPGIRELGFWGVYKKDLQEFFVDFRRYAEECQFADCSHINEPGCAVKMAVESEEIFPERYENYLMIYESLKSAAYEYRINRTQKPRRKSSQ